MSTYGLKLSNTAGDIKILTPDDGTIIAAGSTTMSNSLEGDNTYGEDIALGATYDEDEIGVLVVPRRPIYGVNYNQYIDTGTLFYNTFYLDSAKTYYTRNDANGVMTSFSAGNKTVNVKNTWNPVLSVFPIAFWDKMGASTFSNVRLFAATTYLIRELDNDTNYSLSGSASGSTSGGAGPHGTVGEIKDDDVDTFYGNGCGVQLSNSCAYSYECQVTFSPATIFKAESLQEEFGVIGAGGNYAIGSWKLRLYYNTQWNDVLTGDWDHTSSTVSVLRSVSGHWKNVSGIRLEVSGSAQNNFAGISISEHVCYELRAWGTTNTDDSENETVYSIGNQGITTVDYMVCRKRFT